MLTRICFLFSFLMATTAYSQNFSRDIIATAGETFTKSGISISYVIGDVVGDVLPPKNEFRFLTFGFVQPDFEWKEIADKYIDANILALPNLTHDGNIKLLINKLPKGPYNIDIFDVLGRKLKSTSINYDVTTQLYYDYNFAALPAGVYFIRLTSDTKSGIIKYTSSIKVIKTN